MLASSNDPIARGKSIWRRAATGKFIVPDGETGELVFPKNDVDQSPILNQVGIVARSAVCFDVTNVAEYFYAVSGQEYWVWQKDVPCMTPPFETVWMEHGQVSWIRYKDEVTQPSSLTTGYGVIFQSARFDEPERFAYSGSSKTKVIDEFFVRCAEEANGEGWMVTASLFSRQKGDGVIYWPFQYLFSLDKNGKPNKDPQMFSQHFNKSGHPGTLCEVAKGGLNQIYPFALALSFLHCKNIRIGDVEDARKPSDRARDLRAGIPEVKFKTLEIEPMRKVLVTEGGIAQNGLKKALHICRGHFSEYSEEKPLFGKYSGRFWIPAHVRGTTESGQVVKDYKVKAPKEVAA